MRRAPSDIHFIILSTKSEFVFCTSCKQPSNSLTCRRGDRSTTRGANVNHTLQFQRLFSRKAEDVFVTPSNTCHVCYNLKTAHTAGADYYDVPLARSRSRRKASLGMGGSRIWTISHEIPQCAHGNDSFAIETVLIIKHRNIC